MPTFADQLNWPDAVGLCGVALSFAIGYVAWRITGGKHSDER